MSTTSPGNLELATISKEKKKEKIVSIKVHPKVHNFESMKKISPSTSRRNTATATHFDGLRLCVELVI